MKFISIASTLLMAGACLAETLVPAPTKPDEPMAKSFNAGKAADFIDGVSLAWTRERKCATCHTNAPYMLARPKVQGGDLQAMKEIREFMENRVKGWEKAKPRNDYDVVATAFSLAANDAATTGKLHPLTRAALDRMWTVQLEDGSWSWPDCDWPPLEHDQFYGIAYVAIAVALAPDNYVDTPAAKAGLEKLRKYLKSNPSNELHHKASLLWASTKVPGLLTESEKKEVVEQVRKLQLADGGWNTPAMGPYPMRKDKKTPNPMDVSDGYGTGFALFVLRQAGVPANDPAIQKGVAWLQANQRSSGRWFTASVGGSKHHYLTNVGSAFAVLALDSCGVKLKAE